MKSEIRDILVNLLDKQIKKGVATYGHTLDECPNDKYDWHIMALEEAIDLQQYLVKKMVIMQKDLDRKEKIIQQQALTIQQLVSE